MIETEKILGSVAAQLMNGEEVVVADQTIPVERVGRGRLRMIQFRLNGRVFEPSNRIPKSPAIGANWRARNTRWCSFAMSRRTNMWRCRSMAKSGSTERAEHSKVVIPRSKLSSRGQRRILVFLDCATRPLPRHSQATRSGWQFSAEATSRRSSRTILPR